MKMRELPEEVTITGYAMASDWDWDDAVTGVSIETHDDEYVVDPNGMGEELLSELDSEVEVTGFIKEDRDGTKRITVTSYEVLSEASDRENEYYGYDEDGQEFGSEQGETQI